MATRRGGRRMGGRRNRRSTRGAGLFRSVSMAPKSKAVAILPKPVTRAVQRLIHGNIETKQATFYEKFYNQTDTPARYSGSWASRGWSAQNQRISTNLSDIKQLIPLVLQGTGDFNRLGNRIAPVSLTVSGAVRLIDLRYNTNLLTNFKVVIYVLQHVTLKSYDALFTSNDFNTLLDTGEGTSVAFLGEQQNLGQPVDKKVYHVYKRLIIPLKYAGYVTTGAVSAGPVSVSNAHVWKADYNINLTKHLPKHLNYPENGASPFTVNAPTNSSLFMAMGYVADNVQRNTGGDADPINVYLDQTYVSQMRFKDA